MENAIMPYNLVILYSIELNVHLHKMEVISVQKEF